MSLVQLIECTKCGHNRSIPYDSTKPPQMPWEAWPNGCPKCGHKKVDVTMILDKAGHVKDAKIVSVKRRRGLELLKLPEGEEV